MASQRKHPELLDAEICRTAFIDAGRNARQMARNLGVSLATVLNHLNLHGISRNAPGANAVYGSSPFPPLELTGDAIVCSDWHIPCHDRDLANKLLEVARREKIKTLVVAGDFFDAYKFSSFDKRENQVSFREEIGEAKGIIEAMLKHFSKILFICGNHERRILRTVFYELDLSDIFKMATKEVHKRVLVSERDYLILHTKQGDWRICHPRNYSQIKGRIAYRLAGKYRTNLIMAHGHFFGLVFSEDGQYIGIDSGGMFDPRKVEYIQDTTTYPEWNQGFVVVKNGFPSLVNSKLMPL